MVLLLAHAHVRMGQGAPGAADGRSGCRHFMRPPHCTLTSGARAAETAAGVLADGSHWRRSATVCEYRGVLTEYP